MVAETIKIVSTSLLGLTVGCAQCHSHRYDPISHEDYYRFRALFEPAYDPSHWRTPSARLVSLWTDAERARQRGRRRAALDRINGERSEEIEALVASRSLEKELEAAPEELRPKLREARDAPKDKRTAEQNELLKEYPRVLVTAGQRQPLRRQGRTARSSPSMPKLSAEAKPKPAGGGLRPGTDRGPRPGADDAPLRPRRLTTSRAQEVEPGELTVLTPRPAAPEIPRGRPGPADHRPSAGLRPAPDRRRASAGRPRPGQPRLDAPLRPGDRRHPRRLRPARRAADAPRIARLAGRRVHGRRLDAQADPSADHDLDRLSAVVAAAARARGGRPREPAARPDARPPAGGRGGPRRDPGRERVAEPGAVRPAGAGRARRVGPDHRRQGHPRLRRPADRRKTGGLGGRGSAAALYVQVRRSMPLGLLEAFDAPAMAPNCERRDSSTVAPQSLDADEQRLRPRSVRGPGRPRRSPRPAPTRPTGSAWPGGSPSAAGPTPRRSTRPSPSSTPSGPPSPRQRRREEGKEATPARPTRPGESLPRAVLLERVPVRRLTERRRPARWPTPCNTGCTSRRHFLATQGMSLGSLALAWLLHQDGALRRKGRRGSRPWSRRPTT